MAAMHFALRRLGLAAALLFGTSAPALADLTVFAGLQGSPSIRPGTGIALGIGLFVVGWEVEVARISEDLDDAAPSLSTGMVSLYVQNPIPISGVQFYGIVGAGLYRERLTGISQETNGHVAIGGGAKIELVGPLKLRLDYRLFKLRGDTRHPTPQRVYAGLTLSF